MSTTHYAASGAQDKNRVMSENENHEKSSYDTSLGSGSGRRRKAASAFRTISEVADELDVQQHVLRFWETKFSQVKPLKRGGGRRYYRPEDVVLLRKIHHLLYTEGYTIKGVQKLLKGHGKQQIVSGDIASGGVSDQAAATTSVPSASAPAPARKSDEGLSAKQRSILEAMLGDLRDLRDMIKAGDKSKD